MGHTKQVNGRLRQRTRRTGSPCTGSVVDRVPCVRKVSRTSDEQTYLVHSDQDMFQPFKPLSGAICLSFEFCTITTSPMSEEL